MELLQGIWVFSFYLMVCYSAGMVICVWWMVFGAVYLFFFFSSTCEIRVLLPSRLSYLCLLAASYFDPNVDKELKYLKFSF